MDNISNKKSYNKTKWKSEGVFIFFLFFLGACILPTTSPFCKHSVMSMTSDYFNFAKSMIHGKELYLDLFDHKGLFLFLLYYPAYWISPDSYMGVFVLEGIISGSIVVLGYIYMRIHYDKWRSFCASLLFCETLYLLFPMSMYNSECFGMIFVLVLLIYIESGKCLSYGRLWYFTFGIMFSVLFWTKYPLITLLFPFFLFLFIHAINFREIRKFIFSCAYSFMAFAVFSGLIVAYFIKHHTLRLMIQSYFGGVHPKITFPSGSAIEIICLLLISMCIRLLLLNRRKLEKGNFKLYTVFWLTFILIILNLFGGMRTYSVCFITLLLLMVFPVYITSIKFMAAYAFIVALFAAPNLDTNFNPSDNAISELADKYQITNENILYLDGDLGFGCYSDYGFIQKYQWIPDRISFDDNTEMYEAVCGFLENQTFEYMVIAKNNYKKESTCVSESRNQTVSRLAVENYDVIEEFQFRETCTSDVYLCKRNK